jgi:hypothetical protein
LLLADTTRAAVVVVTVVVNHPMLMLFYHRDIVPLGSSKTDWNFDISTHKRILNEVHVVTDEDNIKQDKSIDVYDRFSDEDEEKAE